MGKALNSITKHFLSTKINIETLISFAFFILVFYSVFDTKLFLPRSDYLEGFEAESTNVYNQLIYSFLFLVAVISLFYKYKFFLSFIKKEKFLLIFVFLCVLSALWSDYPDLSLKRSFQLLIKYLIIVITLLNIDSKRIIKILKFIVSLYIFINLIFSLFNINSSIDPVFGTWRGIEFQKNGLGQISLYCFLATLMFYQLEKRTIKQFYNIILMFLSIFLIFMARSSSVIITLILILTVLSFSGISNLFKNYGLRNKLILFLFLIFFAFLLILFLFSKDIFALVPEIFGKDLTLSGRVPIWLYVWADVQSRFLLGFGYATYWIMGSSRIDLFAINFGGFKVNEAHNGYLEILLQLGIIGLLFLLVLILVYLYRTIKIKNNLALIVFLFIVVINLTESLWFQVRGQLTIIFIAVYSEITIKLFRLSNKD